LYTCCFFSFKDMGITTKFIKTRTINHTKGLISANIQINTNNINRIAINALTRSGIDVNITL
jgi:hypothetical protein